MKKLFKLFAFFFLILSYFAFSMILICINFFSLNRARKYLVWNISFHSRMGLKLFGVKVKKCFEHREEGENYLLVSNHLSYLDILIIASSYPACFVTSLDMKRTPFLGQLCSIGGCLFVNRSSRLNLSNEVQDLTRALKERLNVVVFPEATSTNGEQVLRFKRPLFQAAIDANCKVVPLCLNYKKIDYDKIQIKNRDKVFWYGDMGFFSHLVNILEVEEIVVELNILRPLVEIPDMTKSILAEISYSRINEYFLPIKA